MSEAIDIAKVLHGTPDLFPWVCLVIVLIIIFANRSKIGKYIDSRIEANESKKHSDAIMEELVRNNTAALNNNTAALESVKQDRGETRRLLSYHEEMSAERDHHIQEVVNRIDKTVTNNSMQIGLIEDRTETSKKR